MLERFFPQGIEHYLLGGLLIGSAVGLLFILTGLIGGMSTFFSSTWSWISALPHFRRHPLVSTRIWRGFYAAGLICGAGVYLATLGEPFRTGVDGWRLLLGGFLAGFGARLGNGCTSGHGICGLASLQLPSLLAVLIFLATAIGTARLTEWLGGV